MLMMHIYPKSRQTCRMENKQEIEKIRETFNQALCGHVTEIAVCSFTLIGVRAFLYIFFPSHLARTKDCPVRRP